VASLVLVSPGEANKGVTPIFFSKKLMTFLVVTVCHFCHSYFFTNLTTFFAYHSLSISLILLGCHPLESVTPDLLCLCDLVSTLLFVNFAHKIFFQSGVTPWRVSSGRFAPLVTPQLFLLSSETHPVIYNTLASDRVATEKNTGWFDICFNTSCYRAIISEWRLNGKFFTPKIIDWHPKFVGVFKYVTGMGFFDSPCINKLSYSVT